MVKSKPSDSDNNEEEVKQPNGKRSRLSQTDVPSTSIDEALRIPQAIADNYAFKPTRPLEVAAALGVSPTSGHFRMLTGSSIAYGLTDGGSNAPYISVKPLARRIIEPLEEGDDVQARRQALLLPRVPREFLTKYDGNKLPKEDIARNVLLSMSVPKDSLDRTLKLIIDSARLVGFLRDIKGSTYVNLQNTLPMNGNQTNMADVASQDSDIYELPPRESDALLTSSNINKMISQQTDTRRVFITHGKNKSFIEPLKRLLAFGELEPVVSIERESVLQSIPEKVLSDMRSCGSAIIHIEDEQKMLDSEGNEHIILNPNVLIEIGAAMALYEKRFILLVKSGVTLPSNLNGLYEIRYEGENFDFETTIKVLGAIKDVKGKS